MISASFNKRLQTTWRTGATAPSAGPIHLCSPSCLSATCARSRFPLLPWCNYHVWLTRADGEGEGHNARTFEGLSRKKKKKRNRKRRVESQGRAATWQHGRLPDKHTKTRGQRETEGGSVRGTVRRPHYLDLAKDGLINQEGGPLFCVVVDKQHERLVLPGPVFQCCL